jgi:hypothetical protein
MMSANWKIKHLGENEDTMLYQARSDEPIQFIPSMYSIHTIPWCAPECPPFAW